MDAYERMVDGYDWPEPVVEDEVVYSSAIEHLPFLEERVNDHCLELVGEWVEDIVFTEHEELGGYYDAVESTVYIYCEHEDTQWIQDGDAWRVSSPMIHEIGHVVHDFHGVSLFNNDYHELDNRGVERSEWQLGVVESNEFSSQVITLWESFRQHNFPSIWEYQERNISEFITVAFEQWVASPALMIHDQPSMVRFFDSWVGREGVDTFDEFQCLCRDCPGDYRWEQSGESEASDVEGEELIVELEESELSAD